MTTFHSTICLIGAGPRGLSVLERLCANARSQPADRTLRIHVVDPYPPGAGQVWRTDQSPHLLMNTVAGQISAFTDATVDLEGPLEPGPSLHAWAAALAGEPATGNCPGGHPDGGPDNCPDGYPESVLAQARTLGPDSYPTRAFYGHYLRWAYRRIVKAAPATVTITSHRCRALRLDEDPHPHPHPHPHLTGSPGGDGGSPRQRVRLSDGSLLEDLDAVILCQGHLPARPTATEAEFAARARKLSLAHFPPANPADVDLDAVPEHATVLLRGLGLNFFDYLAQFTHGRGGIFTRTAGQLLYQPSGREPRLLAGSRRGIPHQARGENEKGPHHRHEPLVLTAGRLDALRRARGAGGLDFTEHLWPLIAHEVETVYYRTLFTSRGHRARADQLQADYLAAAPAQRPAVLDSYGIGEKYRFDWQALARPYRERQFTGPEDFTGWLVDHLRQDVAEARAGNVSNPLKAALDVLRDVRNEIRLAVDHAGLHGDSHRTDLDGWYTPLNAHLSIGPPAHRIEEMTALIDAGVLSVVGPGLRVEAAPGGYRAHSPYVPGSARRADLLIEARLPATTLARTGDVLLGDLLERGQCTTHRIPARTQQPHDSDGLAVTRRPFHLIDAAGRPHPRRFAFGVPTEGVHWVTAAGIRPGVGSLTLTDADAIARAALAHPAAGPNPPARAGERP
ncbi:MULTISPECIES: FAD/NAD(P)-binding protein [unclassified Streptomyces]|uniref:FAD/NAD(P)-binding protein n=1 Tax=unclassified Streptomyces TaxID=2593676 RepID=UPI0034075C6F